MKVTFNCHKIKENSYMCKQAITFKFTKWLYIYIHIYIVYIYIRYTYIRAVIVFFQLHIIETLFSNMISSQYVWILSLIYNLVLFISFSSILSELFSHISSCKCLPFFYTSFITPLVHYSLLERFSSCCPMLSLNCTVTHYQILTSKASEPE